jgi:hypothetical protein
LGDGHGDQVDEEPGAGEYRVGQDVLTSVTLHLWKLWLQDLVLDSLEIGDERGDCRGMV